MSEWMACNFWTRQPLAAVEEQPLQTCYSVVQAFTSAIAFHTIVRLMVFGFQPSLVITGFYFSSVPKLKIRHGGVVDDIPPPLSISSTVFVPEIVVPQAPETMVSSSSSISLALEVTSEVPSVPFPAGPVSLLKNFRQSGKRKAAVDSKEEMSMPKKEMDDAGDSQRTGQGREDPSSNVEDRVPQDRGASRIFIPPPAGKYEYINIGSCRDELDPTVLRKLPAPVAIAVASVHKY
ncbi:hypothetical protein Fot_28505 [Forsythia ovata]|uniref:Uncharacterized protein n=1 Tax=Forsythia ovata TaxID=205694 RepID=A0ABD1TPB1_9LAMI